jgi:hypothetical protein
MKIWEFIAELEKHNPEADVRFSVEIADSFDSEQRFFCEDGPGEITGNAHPLLGRNDETLVTVCLLAQSNM